MILIGIMITVFPCVMFSWLNLSIPMGFRLALRVFWSVGSNRVVFNSNH